MIRQHCIPLASPEEWRDALQGIRHTFGHTWENCHAMNLTTGLETYLYCYENGNIRIVSPITERNFNSHVDIVKPFGFSGFVRTGDCPEFRRHWAAFTRERGYVCGYLGLNPIFDCNSLFQADEIYPYDTIHVLDLTLSDEALWANLSSNRRRQLKDWDQIRPTLVHDKTRLVDFFLENYMEFFRRKGASEFYHFSRETLAYLFGLEEVTLVGAPDPDRLEAVSVFTRTADAGEYLFNISVPGGKDYANALLWYGVNHFKSIRIPLLNLGGGSGGVGESKRRYGGKEFALKCVKQVYEPQTYELLCRQAGADPGDRSGYFPAYRKSRPPSPEEAAGSGS